MHLVLQVLEATTQVNGPEHYLAGQKQQNEAYNNASTAQEEFFHLTAATNHFLAALVALLAADRAPESIAWQQATASGEGAQHD